MDSSEISKHIESLVTNSGRKVTKEKSWTHTKTPSVQGTWSAFTFEENHAKAA